MDLKVDYSLDPPYKSPDWLTPWFLALWDPKQRIQIRLPRYLTDRTGCCFKFAKSVEICFAAIEKQNSIVIDPCLCWLPCISYLWCALLSQLVSCFGWKVTFKRCLYSQHLAHYLTYGMGDVQQAYIEYLRGMLLCQLSPMRSKHWELGVWGICGGIEGFRPVKLKDREAELVMERFQTSMHIWKSHSQPRAMTLELQTNKYP